MSKFFTANDWVINLSSVNAVSVPVDEYDSDDDDSEDWSIDIYLQGDQDPVALYGEEAVRFLMALKADDGANAKTTSGRIETISLAEAESLRQLVHVARQFSGAYDKDQKERLEVATETVVTLLGRTIHG